MPEITIEIHGVSRITSLELRAKIFALFVGKSYADDMVVEILSSEITDRKGDSKPYLRVFNYDQYNSKEIIGTLRTLNYDIQHIALTRFISKR